MSSLSSIYSSSNASASLLSAFAMKSQAALWSNLWASAADPGAYDNFSFTNTMPAADAGLYTALIQGGNSAIFGTVFTGADDFNEQLMGAVAASAGMEWDMGDLLDVMG